MNANELDLPLEISPAEVQALREAGEAVFLVDCRESEENSIARIEGAMLIPMNETPQRIGEFDAHRHERIVVHCHHGGRSLQVAEYLRKHGFHQSQSMSGGIECWSQEVDPQVPRY